MECAPSEDSDQPGHLPVWSESLLSTWSKFRSLAAHWQQGEDSDQTGRMPTLIWVFAGWTVIFLVLSWGGSYEISSTKLILWTGQQMLQKDTRSLQMIVQDTKLL